MQVIKYPSPENWEALCKRPSHHNKSLQETVSDILVDVQKRGDIALSYYAKKFDKVDIEDFSVSMATLHEAYDSLSNDLKEAINVAKANIERFHSNQITAESTVETTPGITCWRKSVGIEKVGLYIPGGTAPLFSTVLMLAIPAKLAGCKEIVLCTPPGKDGNIHPAILYTAQLIGIDKVFKIGGAQAIAAMAYGTSQIPQVYKIFGPGNQFVTLAKQLVNAEGIAIDMPAGPSEVLIMADDSANPEFIAADLLSQAEHGADSQVILVTDSENIANLVVTAVNNQVETLPRKELAEKALVNSKIIILQNMNEAITFSNYYAPEHLIINTKHDDNLAQKITNAGSVFLGNYTPESLGDYASGTNHTLPTNGYAKAYSGVSVDSFCKKITFQKATKQGLANIGTTVETMATNELLMAHKNAVSIRLKEIEKK